MPSLLQFADSKNFDCDFVEMSTSDILLGVTVVTILTPYPLWSDFFENVRSRHTSYYINEVPYRNHLENC